MKIRALCLTLLLCFGLIFAGCGKETQTMTIQQFDALLAQQPLAVVSTKYLVQDEEYKSLYPDMLQAVIRNNSNAEIQNAKVAFAAWDRNGLPVKIKGQWDFGNGSYIKEVQYNNINLVAGMTFGKDSGFELDTEQTIDSFVAIAMSYETFDGQKWENPYYDEFCKLYSGQKKNPNATVAVEVVESAAVNFSPAATAPTAAAVNAQELEDAMKAQPLVIIDTNYLVQDEQYKALYPDMLQAIIQNNSDADIESAVIGFLAWDENNLPVKIKGQFDYSGGSYFKRVNYTGINMIPGATYGDKSGFELDDGSNIATFKAIVVSYTTFEGETWENPLVDAFLELYEGKKLN